MPVALFYIHHGMKIKSIQENGMWACLEQKKHTSTKYKQSDLLITLNGMIKKPSDYKDTHRHTQKGEEKK